MRISDHQSMDMALKVYWEFCYVEDYNPGIGIEALQMVAIKKYAQHLRSFDSEDPTADILNITSSSDSQCTTWKDVCNWVDDIDSTFPTVTNSEAQTIINAAWANYEYTPPASGTGGVIEIDHIIERVIIEPLYGYY